MSARSAARASVTVPWKCVQILLAGLAAGWLAGALGVPDALPIVVGVIAGLAVWRPPPANASKAPDLPALEAVGPGLVLGRVTVAPSQTAPVFVGQRFWFALTELGRHVTLIGTTGSGKTTTVGRLMDAAMSAGWSVMVVDAKGGRLADVCRALGDAHEFLARIWLPGQS